MNEPLVDTAALERAIARTLPLFMKALGIPFPTRWQRFKSRWLPATKLDLDKAEHRLMTKIAQFAGAVTTHLDKIDAGVSGVSTDVTELQDLVAKLQNSTDEVSDADQALLDKIQARVGTTADKVAALDALQQQAPTPPVEEPQPPVEGDPAGGTPEGGKPAEEPVA